MCSSACETLRGTARCGGVLQKNATDIKEQHICLNEEGFIFVNVKVVSRI